MPQNILVISSESPLFYKGLMTLPVKQCTRVFIFYFKPGLKVIKLFSCSTQLSMKFTMLINVKMPTIVSILTFISMLNRFKARSLYFSVF